ncbi:MAG: putative toxin-antitoxin system toxin component, PIN family [Paludibacteraceae bacterium]|nr:putative toxin-antitoxin system toxin component, PIN family [Paludibacteraceae bacterium]
MNVVLDSNVVLQVAFTQKPLRVVWEKLLSGAYTLCVTEDILFEYQEKVIDCFHNEVLANLLINTLLNCPYVKRVETFFRYDLIKADPDDNKFVDCALACNAKYIVTEDTHFDVLKEIDFPKVDVCNLTEFIQIVSRL